MDDKDIKITMGPQVLAQMEKDPEMAEAVRTFTAALHQANHDVQMGKYPDIQTAIEAITGCRPEPIDSEDGYTIREIEDDE